MISGMHAGCLRNAELHAILEDVRSEQEPFMFLVRSACPSIVGNDMVKAGLLLALFGGTDRNLRTVSSCQGNQVRQNCHVLLIGDPGMRKSQLLKGMCRIAPRSLFVCGSFRSSQARTYEIDERDTRYSCGMSRAEDLRKLSKLLFSEARLAGTKLFTEQELRELARSRHITGERFERVIEAMNFKGGLLKKGGRCYELARTERRLD